MPYLPKSCSLCLSALMLALLVGCESNTPQPVTEESAPEPVHQSQAKSQPDQVSDTTAETPTSDKQSTDTPQQKMTPVAAGQTPAKSENAPHKSAGTHSPKPLFEGWPAPKLAIVLTGERHGYLEPCGCTQNQTGGVSLLANLFKQIEDRKWPVTAFDLGGLVKRNRRQSQIKYETILAAMKDMKYGGLALGPEELRFGADIFLQLHNPEPPEPNTTPTFLAANILILETPELGKKKFKIVEVAGVKIAVTSILGKTRKGQFPDITWQEPAKVLPDVIKEMQAAKPDLMLLLSQSSKDESKTLARQFPQFDILLTAGGVEDPLGEPEFIGKTMMVDVGHKGKSAGVVGYYPEEGAKGDPKKRFRFTVIELDKERFKDTPKMAEHMQFYQDRLKQEDLAAKELPIDHPRGATFVGAEKCGECHTKAYEKWLTTAHAHAYESLINGRKDQIERGEKIVSRIYDPECLSCHVTGWHPQEVIRYKSGFVNKQQSPHLLGQQCENCHGPGSGHIELVDMDKIEEAKKVMRVTLAEAKKTTCYKCHDLDNSPNFNFDTYWEKIKHPWRD
ncbi:Cytochrome c-554 precursor [Gimesia panareensis]|uniref:Cytochrome c-554 n=1 Tax=Gimesia panareensis TaxID=2527978 RepID=A0A518FNH7_9PLAN|nr:multiheme c-type cytochrome [Gimesia panareensis]QDV17912.1 Cytochrome c-554 precursor [Gimesia panareensis]